MSKNKSIFLPIVVGSFIGAIVMYFALMFSNKLSLNSNEVDKSIESQKPLYWVAPMDSNYRRDKPGKSPMGMDLVPVYANVEVNGIDEKGIVSVSPHMSNNLGIRISQARLDRINADINTVGYVQFDEDRMVHMHPRVKGWIERLYVKSEGEPVSKGQPVYAIYSLELVNAQDELLLAIKGGDSALIRSAITRLKALHVSQQTIDDVIKDGQARQTIIYRAPQDGVVNQLPIREGFFVEPKTTLISIVSLDTVWVEAEVFEQQSRDVHLGQAVKIHQDNDSGKQWLGVVDYIYPVLDPVTRTLRVRLRFENAEHQLKPNMFTNVTIQSSSSEPTVIIPREALIRTQKQDRVVLVKGDGKFKSVAVQVGKKDSESIEILSGILEGDRIVVSAQFLLDSESSKSSDFLRMGIEPVDHSMMDHSMKDEPELDHSKMDHSTMGHSTKDQSKPDHSKMDHSTMEHSKKEQPKHDHSKMDHSTMDHSKKDGASNDEGANLS